MKARISNIVPNEIQTETVDKGLVYPIIGKMVLIIIPNINTNAALKPIIKVNFSVLERFFKLIICRTNTPGNTPSIIMPKICRNIGISKRTTRFVTRTM